MNVYLEDFIFDKLGRNGENGDYIVCNFQDEIKVPDDETLIGLRVAADPDQQQIFGLAIITIPASESELRVN